MGKDLTHTKTDLNWIGGILTLEGGVEAPLPLLCGTYYHGVCTVGQEDADCGDMRRGQRPARGVQGFIFQQEELGRTIWLGHPKVMLWITDGSGAKVGDEGMDRFVVRTPRHFFMHLKCGHNTGP